MAVQWRPVGYQIRILVWVSKKVMAKGHTGYTEFNPEKQEGRETEAASQSDENIKGKPRDSGRGSAAGWCREEGEFG